MKIRYDLEKAYKQGFYGIGDIAANQITRHSKQNAELALIHRGSKNPATCQYYLARTSEVVWG